VLIISCRYDTIFRVFEFHVHRLVVVAGVIHSNAREWKDIKVATTRTKDEVAGKGDVTPI
jgi:hypothetical protein